MNKQQKKKIIRDELCKAAQAQTVTHYSELGRLTELDMASLADRDEISDILGDINIEEYAQERPLLSAVAVLMGENRPGVGFWNLAHDPLGLYNGDRDPAAQDAFWTSELKDVYAYWSTHPCTP